MLTAVVAVSAATLSAQRPLPGSSEAITVEGRIRNAAGEPIAGVSLRLEKEGNSGTADAKTDAGGSFALSTSQPGTYRVRAEKSGFHAVLTPLVQLSAGEKRHLDLVLESWRDLGNLPSSSALPPPSAMELHDEPNFVVAGVTDGTNMGGHGSETSRRTSEVLTRETLALKAVTSPTSSAASLPGSAAREASESERKLRTALVEAPGSFEANHQLGNFYLRSQRYREAIPLLKAAYQMRPDHYDNAYDLALAYQGDGDFLRARGEVRRMLASVQKPELYHLLADLDERLDDPIAAVREYQQAVRLGPSEQNYFDWATELLLHRAFQAAVEVFTKGATLHPASARMLVGLGAALHANGSYDEAARRVCAASDLSPGDPAPYVFLGRMEAAASVPLPCTEQKLARFVHDQPGNALAKYYYAMALWKRVRGSENSADLRRVEELLNESVKIDSKFDQAYLELGILASVRGDLKPAVVAYQRAIELNPQLAEAHYWLGLAYKRVGEEAKAQEEFQLYQRLDKAESDVLERQRRELRQYLITLKGQSASVH